MKFIHISDLHIGIKVNEYSLLEDQEYILNQIIDTSDKYQCEGVIIAGDVYDKTVPPTEAVQLFDKFINELSKRNLKVFIISGNHDSPERVAFGSQIMSQNNIYISPVYNGCIDPVVCEDEYGELNIYMIPFVKPSQVRRFFPDEKIEDYTDALRCIIDSTNVDYSKRNLLIVHQFVTPSSCDDEIAVGGSDNVNAKVFDGFDYVALGHIHTAQNVGSPLIRYCGTPLKYSFAEAKDAKSVTVLELQRKGRISYGMEPLNPMRDVVEIKGKYDEITAKSYYENTTLQNDYLHITLTDEEDIPNAIGKLRSIYHGLMKLDYDNTRTRKRTEITEELEVEVKTPFELVSDFYKMQNNQEMSAKQQEIIQALISEVWDE